MIKIAVAGAALAAAALTACGGSAPSSPAACKNALASQVVASENGSQAARNAPLPRQCDGLAPSVISSISDQVVQSALAQYLKEHT